MICYTKKHKIPFEIDDEDYDLVSRYTWRPNSYGYLVTHIGKHGQASVHRLIMGNPVGMDVDHVDGNPKNNCKANLRLCTTGQNIMNSKPQTGRSSKYKGVSWKKHAKSWEVYLNINGKRKHIGYFKNEDDAGRKYNEMATLYYGSYANLNVIGETDK